VTSEEQEEFLIPYDPVLPDDPRRVVSHGYVVNFIALSPLSLLSALVYFEC
jgi:hypothetical protein